MKNNYVSLKFIDEQLTALKEAVTNTGTDDEWIDEAIKQGLIVSDRTLTRVYKKLESFGPVISIYTHVPEVINPTFTHEKLVGSARYTAYNDKWEIQNFE